MKPLRYTGLTRHSAPWRWLAALVLLGGLPACGPAPGMMGDEAVFDPDWVVGVDIEMAPADWEALGRQQRDISSVFCNPGPPVSPFTNFEASVTIDGLRLSRVGVRKKGFFGSLDPDKPSLKLSFNEYVRGQRYFGLRRMTLNNCKQDPSLIKQCLGYWLFDRAGVIAPRCNFALVRVNGEELGLYAHIEGIQSELLARYFADPTGNLYEGALSDFQPNWVGTFQKKTNEASPDRSDLDAMVEACAAPDDELLAALAPLVDLERFYDFWVMEVLIAHWDGYSAFNHNNFYLYHDPQSGRFHFIPWGIDGILFDQPGTTRSVFADGILAHRLYALPETRQVYLERLEQMLNTVWDVDAIRAEINRLQVTLVPYAWNARGALLEKITEVERYVETVPGNIRAEIASGPVEWNKPLGSPPCLEQVGDIDLTFSTTWGTITAPDVFAAGTGTFRATVRDEEWVGTIVGSVAGWEQAPAAGQAPKPQILVAAVFPGAAGDRVAMALLVVNRPELVAPGQTVPLNLDAAFGYMTELDLTTGAPIEPFIVMDGDLTLQSATTVDGSPVVGAVSSKLRESNW